ncbi:hypothetical protein OAE16_01640 [Porticoccaceae bacterium]|nr:hypothetical protein [Porticoccaceae bacterium]
MCWDSSDSNITGFYRSICKYTSKIKLKIFPNKNLSRILVFPYFSALLISALSAVSLGAQATTYEYDDLGRLIKVTQDSGSIIDYSYDPAGNRTSHTVAVVQPSEISVANATVSEGGVLSFVVTRSLGSSQAVTVDYSSTTGSASSSDFTAVNSNVTFTVGQTSKTITVQTVEDAIHESAETLTLNLTSASGGAVITDSSATGTITNDDSAPAFSINNVSIAEGSNLTFTINKSGQTAFNHSITYVSANGTASGDDYTAVNNTYTFTTAQTSRTFTVATSPDSTYENNETVLVNLSAATSGATISDSQGIGTINNNDTAPSFWINDAATVVEGGTLSFTVTKIGSTQLSHNVSYATANFTATAGSDFPAKSGSLTFANNQTTRTITVATTNDTAYENTEGLYVNLSSPTNGATIANIQYPSPPITLDGQGLGFLTDNDSIPSFSVSNASATEGNNISVTVTLSAASGLTHNINYATINGPSFPGTPPEPLPTSAYAGQDYTATSNTLAFSPGQTSKTITVATLSDSVYELNELFYMNLSSPTGGASIADGSGNLTINNNDTGPSFTINNVTASEGNNLTFTVTKSGSTAVAHNVNYATANGTAAAGSDYTSKSGTLSFSVGQSSKTISVATTNDSTYENNETVNLNLSAATAGATIADSQGIGTINNNDTGPSFWITNATVAEGGTLSFTVNKMGTSTLSHNVSYATSNGSASSSSDYTAKSGTLTFTSSQTSKTVTVATTSDAAYENNETLNINLSSPTSGATIANTVINIGGINIPVNGHGTGTITNNDSPPSFSVNNKSAAEGSGVTFTITLSAASSLTHNINYATANGPSIVIPGVGTFPDPNSAYAGTDFTTKTGTLTFSPGQTSKTVTVSTTSDSLYEYNKIFYMYLSTATAGATISDSSGTGTITNNDTAPRFAINNKTVTEGGTLTFTVSTPYASSFSHNVNYATANGSAAAGSDYTAKSGTLVLPAGQTSKTISVSTIQDSAIESNETMYVNLSAPTNNATINDSQGKGTINNDDTTTVITVRNSGGTLQSPYTQSMIYMSWMYWYFVYDSAGTLVYASAGGGYCNPNAVLPVAGYVMTGNGCEMTYTP